MPMDYHRDPDRLSVSQWRPPVKLSGRISAARHTATSTLALSRLATAWNDGGNEALGVIFMGIFLAQRDSTDGSH